MREDKELSSAAEQIAHIVLNGNDASTIASSDMQNVPYYLTFTVYNPQSKKIIATNDPFIPVLPVTGGKTKRWTQEEYYTDGDLNLLYCAKIVNPNISLAVQTAINMDQDTAGQLLSYLPRTLAFFFLPLLVLSYAAAFLIARQTLKPVSRITKSAQNISSANLDATLPVTKRGDELDMLAFTFNSLFAKLKIDFDRERSFTGNVSHELKTPIGVILGHANLIRRWGRNDPAQMEESLGALISEAHSMENVVANLLQLSRLESGTVKPKSTRVELAPLFARLEKDTHCWASDALFELKLPDMQCDDAQVRGKTRCITDTCETGADVICVLSDEELLYQVFTIIVSNSIKFSPHPAQLKIAVEVITNSARQNKCAISALHSGSAVRITFTDNGSGIAPDVLPHVFERFYRGDESHNRKNGGAGLGLSIAKEIMSVMDGVIEASSLGNESSADGNGAEHGAVIALTLPMA
jgi:signal transduction histidine kinase